ncbi:hypothetical protein DID88_003660 [Monilinia fructigena]|uniref:Elongator complex protein 5 n=1 Tax=Monilinia fructigena TaxID=38457 RepID=A0A395IUA9_9HELO|nr:hypothetical protein DID88_003660 [Monilinia fructigena]
MARVRLRWFLDALGRSGRGVVGEFWRRAVISKSKVIFISFSSLQKGLLFRPDVFISAHSKSLAQLRREIVAHLPSPTASPTASQQKILLIIDDLHTLASHPNHLSLPFSLPYLSTLNLPPLHLSLRRAPPIPTTNLNPYTPAPLTTLLSLATAILEPTNFNHELAQKRARTIQLLDEHPSFAAPEISDNSTPNADADEGIEADVTFNLGLTEKQKRDRENVVLPYFDAQKEGGIGSGGKILYEMGAEDREDFDDEEDEI